MRRYTLCKLCLCVIGLVLFIHLAGDGPQESEACGGPVTAAGVVALAEEREDGRGQRQIIISLHSVTFCDGISKSDTKNKDKTAFFESGGAQYAEGILCYLAEGEETPLIGEFIVVSGQAEAFAGRRNPGGFDAAAYYRAKGLQFCLKKTQIEKRGEKYSGYGQALHDLRAYAGKLLDQVCGEDAGIMRALLLGDKGFLPQEVKDLYRKGGISHILAISGLHISFFGIGLYRLLKRTWLPAAAAAAVSGFFVLSYAVMSGASPSACRAAVMFAVSLLADIAGRSYHRMTALALAALVMAAWRPAVLFQSGFLLSYGAIAGLEGIYPVLSRLWESKIIKPFIAGISVTVVTLPVLLASFFEFPVYSLFLNLFVIPLMGIVMTLGVISLLAGMISLSLGRLLFVPVHLLLAFFGTCCGFTGRLPGSLWVMGAPKPMQSILYCLLLLFFVGMRKYVTRPYAMLVLLGAVWIIKSPVVSGDTVTMLDVGQGDGIVIRCEDRTAVLIDGGSSSEKNLAQYTLLPYLKSEGICRLQYVFLTHMDADHINGTEELIQRGATEGLTIETLVLPALAQQDETYRKIAAEAEAAGIRVCAMAAGDRMEAGGFRVLCLNPQEGEDCADRNAASLVLYMQKGKFSALFMGDLDGGAEEAFAQGCPVSLQNVTVLKAGHHGAKAACGEEFLSKCRPKITLVSCGKNNSYGHPDRETLNRLYESGSRIYVTKDAGAVRVWLCGDTVRVKCVAASKTA